MKSPVTQKTANQKVRRQTSDVPLPPKQYAMQMIESLLAEPKPALRANYLFTALVAIDVGRLDITIPSMPAPQTTNNHRLFVKRQIDLILDGPITEQTASYLSAILTSIKVKPSILEKAVDYACDRVALGIKAKRTH